MNYQERFVLKLTQNVDIKDVKGVKKKIVRATANSSWLLNTESSTEENKAFFFIVEQYIVNN